MTFIQIEDGLVVNSEAIESIERKNQLSTRLVMKSGEKHLTSIPFESLIKIVQDEKDDVAEVLRNIDRNTGQFSG